MPSSGVAGHNIVLTAILSTCYLHKMFHSTTFDSFMSVHSLSPLKDIKGTRKEQTPKDKEKGWETTAGEKWRQMLKVEIRWRTWQNEGSYNLKASKGGLKGPNWLTPRASSWCLEALRTNSRLKIGRGWKSLCGEVRLSESPRSSQHSHVPCFPNGKKLEAFS